MRVSSRPDPPRRPAQSPAASFTPTATSPAASTTRPRPGSRPSRSRRPGEVPGQRGRGFEGAPSSSRSSAPSWSSTTSGCCGPTTSSPRTSRSTRSCTSWSTTPPRPSARPRPPRSGHRPEGPRLHRPDRQDLQGDQEGLTLRGPSPFGAAKGAPSTLRGPLALSGGGLRSCAAPPGRPPRGWCRCGCRGSRCRRTTRPGRAGPRRGRRRHGSGRPRSSCRSSWWCSS